MLLRPEQERALAYLKRRGTDAPVEEIRKKLATSFAQLEGLLAGLDPAVVAIPEGPGRWSIHDVVDHLVETDRRSVVELRSLLAGERPYGGPIPAGLRSPDPAARTWDSLVLELRRLHAEILALLGEAGDDVPTTEGAPVALVLKVPADGGSETLEWVEDLDWTAYAAGTRVHTLEHVQQIQRIAAAVATKA